MASRFKTILSMKRICFFLCLLLHAAEIAFCQDTAWQDRAISPDAFIKMPGLVSATDTLTMHWTTSTDNGYTLQTRYFPAKLEVHSGDELVQAYESFLHGYFGTEQIKKFANTVVDTSIGVTHGEWIHSVYPQGSSFYEMFTYVLLADSHFYMVMVASDHHIESSALPALGRYYSSLHFRHGTPKEYTDTFNLQSKSYRFGERLGVITKYVVLIGLGILIGVFIYIRVRRTSRHRSNSKQPK
jgi:hypothetical protein